VQLLRIAPKNSLQLPEFSLGSGVSMLVAAGEVVFDGKHYGAWSCLYARQDEISPVMVAGADGAEVLFLRYPQHSPTS
jgi:NADH:ubiquinone oxidoreductase subunit B-like Fe-S oxidoreductase